MDLPVSAQLNRKVLRDDVHDALLRMLMTEQLPPGASLSIDSLARSLGVSPTPVREALVQLEHTGLVQREALKGYKVAPPLSAGAMAELMDARMVLEVAAVEGAAEHASEIVADLRAAHAAHTEVVKGHRLDDPEVTPTNAEVLEYFRADWEFHQILIRSCGNRFLQGMAAGLGANVHRMRQSIKGPSDSGAALAEHARVLAAFEAGDRDAAVAAMRDHLAAVRERAVAESPTG